MIKPGNLEKPMQIRMERAKAALVPEREVRVVVGVLIIKQILQGRKDMQGGIPTSEGNAIESLDLVFHT